MPLQRFTLHRLPQGYDNTESSVRKASVFCLVAIYSVIGEELKPYLAQLTGSKVRSLPVCQLSHCSRPVMKLQKFRLPLGIPQITQGVF